MMDLADSGDVLSPEQRATLTGMFDGMMKALFKEEGASLRVEILENPSVQSFIDTHSGILDSAFKDTGMSDLMRSHLQASDRVFSGFKAFHELNESFPQLLDENGNRKPFEQFLNDVRKVDDTYNRRYLNAEYNFAQASAEMAGRWENFDDDDRYYLQYRTQHDDKVRPEHAELEGITLPKSDGFWDEYYPPNGWNCRCTVAEVRRDKYRKSDHDDAIARGKRTLQNDSKGMFKFNPGKQQKTFPDYNPYTISKCKGCDKTKLNLIGSIPPFQICHACRLLKPENSTNNVALFQSYPENLWEHTYITEDKGGFVVTELQRIAEATVNKTESLKFQNEARMCKVIADNRHNVEYLHGVGRKKGETYDVSIDGIPADLKTITGTGSSMIKHARHAFREQGAKIIVFEFPEHSNKFYEKLAEISRKYNGRILFYFKDEDILKEIKK